MLGGKVPIKVSAKKRLRVSARRRLENLARSRALKDAIKIFKKAVQSKDLKAGEKLNRAITAIDKAAKTNVIHKNKAGRLKSKIMKLAAERKIQPVSVKKKDETPKKKAKKPVKKSEKKSFNSTQNKDKSAKK